MIDTCVPIYSFMFSILAGKGETFASFRKREHRMLRNKRNATV